MGGLCKFLAGRATPDCERRDYSGVARTPITVGWSLNVYAHHPPPPSSPTQAADRGVCRVAAAMAGHPSRARRQVRVGVLRRILVTAALVAAGTTLPAQQRAPAPVFEVASVKPIPNDSGLLQHRGFGCVLMSPGRISCIGWARYLIARAYDLPVAHLEQEVIGGPGWIVQDVFEIQAVLPAGDQGGVDTDRVLLMLQRLLADRFKLAVHREHREAPTADFLVIDHIERPTPN